MSNCPFCKAELENAKSFCPVCHAKRGYLRVDDFLVGKTTLIFIGLIMPFIVALFGIIAQNQLGLWLSIAMIIPVLFTLSKLLIGQQWFNDL